MEVVFFDASVLFKAAVTRFILGAAQAGEFRAKWSPGVVREARDSLLAAGRVHALVALEQNLTLVRDAKVPEGDAELATSLVHTDPGDRHVLVAAAAADATTLLTDNVRHFDRAEAERLGIKIATPDELATAIARRNPYAMVRHVERRHPPAWPATWNCCAANSRPRWRSCRRCWSSKTASSFLVEELPRQTTIATIVVGTPVVQ